MKPGDIFRYKGRLGIILNINENLQYKPYYNSPNFETAHAIYYYIIDLHRHGVIEHSWFDKSSTMAKEITIISDD